MKRERALIWLTDHSVSICPNVRVEYSATLSLNPIMFGLWRHLERELMLLILGGGQQYY